MSSLFRKPFKASGNNIVKKSVKRNLLNTLKKLYPNLTDEEWAELLPNKAELSICKMQGTHTSIYLMDNTPYFFDVDGRGQLYPTVYVLWKAPRLMDTVVVEPSVFKFLLRGADLFLPGILPPEGGYTWGKGSKKSVTLFFYGLPVAVGECTVDDKDVAQKGMKGKGIKILHVYKDKLWEMGPRSHPQNHAGWILPGPREGFEKYYEKYGMPAGNDDGALPDDDEEGEEEGADGQGGGADAAADADGAAASSSSSAAASSASSSAGAAESSAAGAQAGDDAAEGGEGGEGADDGKPQLSVEEMDEVLKKAFLTCLKTRVKKADLPILFNKFFAEYVQPCDTDNVLDIKKSSYKKAGNFLTAMAEQGLISVEELSPGVHQVLDLDRSHAEYKAFTPAAEAVAPAVSAVAANEAGQKPLIVELYGPTQPLLPIFTAQGHDKKKLHTKKEALEVLWAYVAAGGLETEGGKNVRLDEVLQKALYRKGQEPPRSVPKKDISELYVAKLSPYHEVNRDDTSEIRKGAVKPVEIYLESRQGKKHVTRVCQLESFAISPDVLAKELQSACAAASTVKQGEGKLAGKEVHVQGLVVRQTTDHLVNKYQVPKKYIQFTDRSKKGKGKK